MPADRATDRKAAEIRLFDVVNEYAYLGHKEWAQRMRELWPDEVAIDAVHAELEVLHAPRRREIAIEINALVAAGVPWPFLDDGISRFPMLAKGERGLGPIEPPERPTSGYCVIWDAAFWRICKNVKERRIAGYLPLLMCWSLPFPKAGDYLSSGRRARFVYHIAEVECFESPRTAKRYTCRLWCTRALPEDVPADARSHTFYWHPRDRKAA